MRSSRNIGPRQTHVSRLERLVFSNRLAAGHALKKFHQLRQFDRVRIAEVEDFKRGAIGWLWHTFERRQHSRHNVVYVGVVSPR